MKISTFARTLCSLGLLSASMAVAQPFENDTFTYQGRLTDQASAVTGLADFRFRLWDNEFGGAAISGLIEQAGITVTDGLFTASIELNDLNALNTEENVWLEIEVREPAGSGVYTTLAGRQLLTATPFSMHTRGLNVNEWGDVIIGNPDLVDLSDPIGSRTLAIVGDTITRPFGQIGTPGIVLKNPVDGYKWEIFGGSSGALRLLGGNGIVSVKVLQITGGSDIAEPFDVTDDTEVLPGMVMAIDPDHAGELRIADSAYDTAVAGIVSGAGGVNTGMTLSQEGTLADGEHPVALTGRVWCWCDADANGPITAGNMLTTSSTPGHAMPVTDRDQAFGAVIGKAMTPLSEGRGLVLVLVNLH
jgi:hypothetical protein